MTRSDHGHLLDRAAAAFVLALLAVGTMVLCVGIPFGGMWALSKLTNSQSGHFIAAMLGLPVLMVAFAPILFWLNRLYLRIRAASLPDGAEEEWDPDAEEPRLIPRGPLEPLLFVSFVTAVVALIVWFFFFAENPLLW